MAQDYIWYMDDLKKVKKNGYKVFTTFSCGGGSSMGYKLAGFEVVGNCEIDPKINEMYVKNHHPKYNFLMGVQDFYKQDKNKIPQELFGIDVLDGSPPCSLFSANGIREEGWGKLKRFREGQAKQILDDLFFEFIKVAKLLQPKVVIAENVKGLLSGNAKGYVNAIFRGFEEIGYDTQLFLLNSATMGVPQRRERVFFVCRRRDLQMPRITLEFHERPITYGEFADTDYIPVNKDILEYKRWLLRSNKDAKISHTVLRTENGKVSGYSRRYIKKGEVPKTQVAGNRHLRFDVPGYTSDRDVCIMSTFPLDYNFCGNPVDYVCGMSVPPFMMRGVARAVAQQLLPFAKA